MLVFCDEETPVCTFLFKHGIHRHSTITVAHSIFKRFIYNQLQDLVQKLKKIIHVLNKGEKSGTLCFKVGFCMKNWQIRLVKEVKKIKKKKTYQDMEALSLRE